MGPRIQVKYLEIHSEPFRISSCVFNKSSCLAQRFKTKLVRALTIDHYIGTAPTCHFLEESPLFRIRISVFWQIFRNLPRKKPGKLYVNRCFDGVSRVFSVRLGVSDFQRYTFAQSPCSTPAGTTLWCKGTTRDRLLILSVLWMQLLRCKIVWCKMEWWMDWKLARAVGFLLGDFLEQSWHGVVSRCGMKIGKPTIH